MKKHANEIIRWAIMPENTKVWIQYKKRKKWFLSSMPQWEQDRKYIVDDRFAEIRKAFLDGKQIQWFLAGEKNIWVDSTDKTLQEIDHNIYAENTEYRIKPEPTYEWKWICTTNHAMLDKYYTEEEIRNGFQWSYVKYEPSKRERKNNDSK